MQIDHRHRPAAACPFVVRALSLCITDDARRCGSLVRAVLSFGLLLRLMAFDAPAADAGLIVTIDATIEIQDRFATFLLLARPGTPENLTPSVPQLSAFEYPITRGL